jgi:hypothetical protein
MTAVKLAKRVGISATSVSRIVRGHSQPKQVTFSLLVKRLCKNSEEQKLLLDGFLGITRPLTEENLTSDPVNILEERERVERWLEARTQAITFKQAVGSALDVAGIVYRRDVCEGIASSDFLIETPNVRTAIECKVNVNRDFEKTIGVAVILRELLHCGRVLVVVPFMGNFAIAASSHSPNIEVLTLQAAVSLLHSEKTAANQH